jgi:hypothetical protein
MNILTSSCFSLLTSTIHHLLGSWNASFSPKANLAVGRPEPKPSNGENPNGDDKSTEEPINDLRYHHAFALFQIYAVIINIPICIYWAGGIQRVNAVLREAARTPSTIILVVIFGIIWGVGTLLFGLACKIAGVGLGTNLSMGVIAVIGTFLPLIVEDTLLSAAGGVICAGLAICCGGLWVSTKALAMRDEDECKLAREGIDDDLSLDEVMERNDDKDAKEAEECESVFVQGPASELDLEPPKIETEPEVTTNINFSLRTSRYLHLRRLTAVFLKSPAQREQENAMYPTWKKVGICLATGICAVQLQFAFIFGQRITDLALGNDEASSSLEGATTESGGAAIIWLLAISIGAPVAIINGIYSSPVPLSSAIKTPLSRHLKLIFTTSLPWISHIHIYGVCATTLLPAKVAASIGWPMLMMITTGQALILSVILGEWKAASSETIRTLKYSVLITVVGIAVLMSSVAVPTNN